MSTRPRFGLRSLALAVLCPLLLSACGEVTGARPSSAATVNGETISMADAERRIELSGSDPQVMAQLDADETGAMRRQFEADALTGLIISAVIGQGAAEMGITITVEDVAEVRAQVARELGGEEEFQRILDEANLTEQDVADLLRDRARQDQIQEALSGQAAVTDAEVQEFYDRNAAGRFAGTASARHLVVQTQEEAEAALERIEGGEDFADVAREVSVDPSVGDNSGDLGEFGPAQMVPEFSQAVFGADAGDLVGPVQTQYGFHVIEVLALTAGPPLADVEAEIRAELESSAGAGAAGRWLEERLEEAEVTVNPRFGTWDASQGRVVPSEPLGESTPDGTPSEPTQ